MHAVVDGAGLLTGLTRRRRALNWAVDLGGAALTMRARTLTRSERRRILAAFQYRLVMSLDIFRIDGKVAWITGGTKGLGFQFASALAGVGADIVINSRHADEAEAAAAKIAETHGVKAYGAAVDVTRFDQVTAFVERVVTDFGSLDILVNNAGVNVREPTVDLPGEECERVVDINLTGQFLCGAAHVGEQVGPHHQFVFDPRPGRAGGASALHGNQGWSHSADQDTGAGVGDERCDGECDLSGTVRDGHEQGVAG